MFLVQFDGINFGNYVTFPKEEEVPKQPTTTTTEPDENDSSSDECPDSDIGNCFLQILFTLIRDNPVSHLPHLAHYLIAIV